MLGADPHAKWCGEEEQILNLEFDHSLVLSQNWNVLRKCGYKENRANSQHFLCHRGVYGFRAHPYDLPHVDVIALNGNWIVPNQKESCG